MRNFSSLSVAAALALAALQTGVVANADNAPVVSKAVSLADLNLSSSKDLAVARTRLRSAAVEVCRSPVTGVDLLADTRCASDSYVSAMRKINAHLSTVGVATTTAVQPKVGAQSKLVSLSDLDLAKSDHLDIVRSRLKAAAKEVCKTTAGAASRADAQCEAATYTSALKKLNEHLVTAALAAGMQPVARVDSN